MLGREPDRRPECLDGVEILAALHQHGAEHEPCGQEVRCPPGSPAAAALRRRQVVFPREVGAAPGNASHRRCRGCPAGWLSGWRRPRRSVPRAAAGRRRRPRPCPRRVPGSPGTPGPPLRPGRAPPATARVSCGRVAGAAPAEALSRTRESRPSVAALHGVGCCRGPPTAVGEIGPHRHREPDLAAPLRRNASCFIRAWPSRRRWSAQPGLKVSR